MEIPLVNRRIIESDMEGQCEFEPQKMPKEMLAQVAALNTIRSIIDAKDLFAPQDFLQKYQKCNSFSLLLEAAILIFKQSDQIEHKARIKDVFFNILLTSEPNYVKSSELETIAKNSLLNQNELDEIKRLKQLHCVTLPVENFEFSPLCTISDWKTSDSKSTSKLIYEIFCKF